MGSSARLVNPRVVKLVAKIALSSGEIWSVAMAVDSIAISLR